MAVDRAQLEEAVAMDHLSEREYLEQLCALSPLGGIDVRSSFFFLAFVRRLTAPVQALDRDGSTRA